MIYKSNNKITGVYLQLIPVISIYFRGYKIWPEDIAPDTIFSCFYNGYWMDEYPWTDDTPWTD